MTKSRLYVFVGNVVPVQTLAQTGGKELIHPAPEILGGIEAQVAAVTKGLGADLVFPALLRKLDRIDASYSN